MAQQPAPIHRGRKGKMAQRLKGDRAKRQNHTCIKIFDLIMTDFLL
jgi:hypothetical protein